MLPIDVPSPDSQESIASNRFSNLNREHAFDQIKIFFLIGLYMDKNLILVKKACPRRILKNGWMQWIPESLEKVHLLGA